MKTSPRSRAWRRSPGVVGLVMTLGLAGFLSLPRDAAAICSSRCVLEGQCFECSYSLFSRWCLPVSCFTCWIDYCSAAKPGDLPEDQAFSAASLTDLATSAPSCSVSEDGRFGTAGSLSLTGETGTAQRVKIGAALQLEPRT